MNLDELQFLPLNGPLPTKTLMNFRRDAGIEAGLPSRTAADARGKLQWVTVEHKRKLIGIARLEMAPPEFCFVAELMILAPYRGQGVGHWIIKRIEQYCLNHGIRRLLLEPRDGTERFYTSQAFVKDPLIPTLLRKDINPFQRKLFVPRAF